MNNKASFLPEDYLDRRLAKRSHALFLTLFAVVILGAIGSFVVLLSQQREAREAHDEVVRRIQVESTQLETIKALETQREAMMRKAAITATLMDPIQKSNVLAELINHMPLPVSLTEVEVETNVATQRVVTRSALQQASQRAAAAAEAEAPPPPPLRTVVLQVTGIAPSDLDVSTFMVSLQTHPLFADVELLETRQQRIDEEKLREFKIKLELDPNLTMADLEPTRRDRTLTVNPMGGDIVIEPAGFQN
ncbi:PilN domain-containing protein [Phycisphaera mikurensis]|uniref:Uncharacterized protein n=1 Tax=Phycisphaera mikurensis (strain NBRC 102666 / KCTC 22515 / FYK2301M01) TaxID=1142394 RepID=I0IHW3_PHYMF|nr:PilN domain-containing protein [Phycisphaera mikurensis]MBB6441092.1 Tfp pilus assembly protein PilN [Phycisphaera mikurensis]BAM04851.1 hypothetical protein PSMK_26920 [Phycisphaera mikurensis NBRC 102666]